MEEGSPLTAWGSAAEKPRAARGPGFFVAVLGAVALLAATSSRWGGGDARPSDLAAADRCVSMVKKGACELSDGCIWSGVEASCVARSKSYSTGNDDDDDDGDGDDDDGGGDGGGDVMALSTAVFRQQSTTTTTTVTATATATATARRHNHPCTRT